MNQYDTAELAQAIKAWGRELGFSDIRIADVNLPTAESGLQAWLDAGRHGEMDYMASHGMLRARPAELVPGARRVIIARMDYLPRGSLSDAEIPSALSPLSPSRERVGERGISSDWRIREQARLEDKSTAVISIYARGRDYHRVLRSRLQQLATRIGERVGDFTYRVFADSAPLMEVELAQHLGAADKGGRDAIG